MNRTRDMLAPIGWMLTLAAFIYATGLLAMALHPAYGATIPRYSQAFTVAAIRTEARAAHLGSADTAALLRLAYRESRYNNWSHARSECHGVLQLSRGMAHGHPWWEPRWNTRRAIVYIKHRYGTPRRALAHSLTRGWY